MFGKNSYYYWLLKKYNNILPTQWSTYNIRIRIINNYTMSAALSTIESFNDTDKIELNKFLALSEVQFMKA